MCQPEELSELTRHCSILLQPATELFHQQQPIWTYDRATTTHDTHLAVGYQGNNAKAYHFTKDWHKDVEIVRAYLEKALWRMKKWADQKKKVDKFKVGDLMLVKLRAKKFKYLHRVHQRLVRKYEGSLA